MTTLTGKPKQLGLTGNIGSGKSTVANLLKDMGATVIDADELAKAATKDPQVLKQIQAKLGQEFVRDNKLDRFATAQKVFNDQGALKTLNSIIHPWIGKKRKEIVEKLNASKTPPKIIIHDIPLLYENGMEKDFDAVIVVYASLGARIKRVVARSSLTIEEAQLRDSKQMSLEEKVRRADIVIDNEGDLEALKREVGEKLEPFLI